VAAVALVAGGILALQVLVPAPDRGGDGPAVVASPRASEPPVVAITPTPTVMPVPPNTAAPSPTAAARPPLTVLNNSRVNGLAARAARDFAAGGWRVAATGNLRGRTPHTTVYYAPGQEAAAAALRRQFPRIIEALPRYDGLPGDGTLTVVVTRDYA
jgi:hypothetical protein